jgi:tetratricopeptide (TPR) repeat protein
MFGRLKSLGSELAPRLQAWTSDRTVDQTEGERLLEEGSYAAAELHLARAVFASERKRQLPRNRIQLRLQLAEAQRRQYHADDSEANKAKLDAAAESARSALELVVRSADKELHAECLDMLSAVLVDRGDCEEVEQLSKEAAVLELSLARPDPKRKALRLERLGNARRRVGRVSDAVTAYKEAVSLSEDIWGPAHMETARILTELGDAYRFLGVYHLAEECLQRALRIHEMECGMEATETLHDLHLFTASCEASGNLESAAAQHERRLALKLRVVGVDLEEIARWQMNLSELHVRWGNTSRARELVMEAVGTFRRERGPRLAGAYEALAAIEEARGQLPEALHELERAAKVWEMQEGHDHAGLIRNLQCRAHLLERMRLPRDAAFIMERLKELTLGGRFAAAS